MAGFSGFDPVIRRLGGIAARRELRQAGWSETDLWFAWNYGNLDRIRIGWYAASDLPDEARAAWAAGGPLACVSALVHYGLLRPFDADNQLALHIALPADGHVSRSAPESLVVHWSTADRYSGTRQAVAPSVAMRQARGCSSPAARAAAARAAEVSRSRIHRGTARAANPSRRRPATEGSSSSPTSQPSRTPPDDRAP